MQQREVPSMKLILNNLSKSFASNQVLRGVDFTFEQGNVYALLGRNGSGKTTLFNLIANELKQDAGDVWIEANGVKRPLVPEELFFMVANPALPNFLTGYEFIEFFMDVNPKVDGHEKTVDEYMNWIGFDEADKWRLIQGYSLGMKNKLQMLMFMILEPAIILMDEPLTSLDVIMQLQIKKLIREIRKNHIILFSTHILQLATDLCDEIVVLNNGVLTQINHDLLKDPAFESHIITILSEDAPKVDLPEIKDLIEDATLVDPLPLNESNQPIQPTVKPNEQKISYRGVAKNPALNQDGDAWYVEFI